MDYTLKPLTTIDIDLALEHAKIFVGTYPSDMVPVARKDSAQAFVINTAPQSTQGEHWTAMILKGSKCLYFDSFGLPIQNHALTTSLKNVGVRTYKYNSCQILGCSDKWVISKYRLRHSRVCSGDQYKPFEPKKKLLA